MKKKLQQQFDQACDYAISNLRSKCIKGYHFRSYGSGAGLCDCGSRSIK